MNNLNKCQSSTLYLNNNKILKMINPLNDKYQPIVAKNSILSLNLNQFNSLSMKNKMYSNKWLKNKWNLKNNWYFKCNKNIIKKSISSNKKKINSSNNKELKLALTPLKNWPIKSIRYKFNWDNIEARQKNKNRWKSKWTIRTIQLKI